MQIISDILEGDFVTKKDLLNSETSLKTDLNPIENKLDTSTDRLDKKIDSFAERLEHKILQSEYRSIIKLGSIVTIVIAAATAVIKFL